MKKLRNEKPDTFLVLACYAAGVMLLALWLAGSLVVNLALHGSDNIQPAELTLDDFEWRELEERDGKLVATGGDPQLWLKDANRRVDSVLFEAAYSQDPLKVNVYYAHPGRGHDPRHMVYGYEDRWFLLPAVGGRQLRIDPGVVAGNTMEIKRIAINLNRPWTSFFLPTAGQWALLVAAPGLAACIIKLARQTQDMRRARKAVRPL